MDINEFVNSELNRLNEEADRLEDALAGHKQIIKQHELKLITCKKLSKFTHVGTFVSIALSIMATLLGYDAVAFASNYITLICIVLMTLELIAMAYFHRKIGLRYSLIAKELRDSMEREMEWVKLRMES